MRRNLTKFCVAVAFFCLAACSENSKPPSLPLPQVVVRPARIVAITPEYNFVGRIQAINRVDLRARVQGLLVAKLVKDGATVKKGDVLFEIEHPPFQAAVTMAQANLESAKAQLTLAQVTFDRQSELKKETFAPTSAVDSARAQLLSAQANVQARGADLDVANINLGYTYITAPMDGKVGRATVAVGDIVNPSSTTPLITLVQDDPIYAIFLAPSRLLLELQKTRAQSKGVDARLILADGSTYPEVGQIAFSEVTANPATDSLPIAATFPNPKNLLVDGQLVNVEILRRNQTEALVVPQTALLLDQAGPYVLSVDADNVVIQKRVKTGDQTHADLIVLEGLAVGEPVIVEGQQKARIGAKVMVLDPQPVAPTAPR